MIGPNGCQLKTYTTKDFVEIASQVNSIIEENKSENEFESYINSLPSIIEPYVKNYFRFEFANKHSKIDDAARYLELVLQDIESKQQNNETFSVTLLKNIYDEAGEFYANINAQSKAIKCYQNQELAFMRTQSCDYSEGLLSFRPFNEYSLSDLLNNEITVCCPRVMNDPYDTLLIKWGECFKNNKEGQKHLEALRQSFEPYRIRSFSRLKNKQQRDTVKNVLMWSHYADGHRGFCIKYKFSEKFIKTEDRFVSRFKEIIYHDRNNPFDLHVNSMSTNQALCTKLNDWEYENEVRLITYAPDVDKKYLKLPLDNNSFIETIYFGYSCTDETQKTIKNALSYNPGIKYIIMDSNYSDIYQLQEKPII